jgi:hypothetical protein
VVRRVADEVVVGVLWGVRRLVFLGDGLRAERGVGVHGVGGVLHVVDVGDDAGEAERGARVEDLEGGAVVNDCGVCAGGFIIFFFLFWEGVVVVWDCGVLIWECMGGVL